MHGLQNTRATEPQLLLDWVSNFFSLKLWYRQYSVHPDCLREDLAETQYSDENLFLKKERKKKNKVTREKRKIRIKTEIYYFFFFLKKKKISSIIET